MKFETILIKNPKTGNKMPTRLDGNETPKLKCSCGGKYTKASDCNAFVFNESKRTLTCPECGKSLEIIQTPAEKRAEKEKAEAERNAKARENLHIVLAGSDWECGFKYYALSANIEYEDWLKVKEHFRYYNRGWSRGQELEFEGFEPTGWLTTNPKAVEGILVDEGLIKPENTMDAIQKRVEEEKRIKEEEMKKSLEKRQEIKSEIREIEGQIKKIFENSERRELSDAEASEEYFNPTYGKCTVVTYSIKDDEVITCRNMVDFKYGVAIPRTDEVVNLIERMYALESELAKY